MRVLSLQKKLLLFITIVLLVALLIVLFIILPSVSHIRDLRQSITTTETFLEEEHLRTQHLRRSVRQLDDVLSQIEVFEAMRIAEGDELAVITEFEQLASQFAIEQSLTVDYVEPAAAGRSNGNTGIYATHPHYLFTFLNNGSFENHVSYLGALERLDYAVVIDGVSLSVRQRNEGGVTPVTAQFQATVFVQ